MTGLRKARRQIPVNVRSWETYSIGLMRTVLMRLMAVLVKQQCSNHIVTCLITQ